VLPDRRLDRDAVGQVVPSRAQDPVAGKAYAFPVRIRRELEILNDLVCDLGDGNCSIERGHVECYEDLRLPIFAIRIGGNLVRGLASCERRGQKVQRGLTLRRSRHEMILVKACACPELPRR